MSSPYARSSRWWWCAVLLTSFARVAPVGAGQLTLSPTNVNFGAVQAGSTPISRNFRIENHGTPTTIFGFNAIAGCTDFTVSAAGLPKVIGAYDTLVVKVVYSPTVLDLEACAIEVHDDNGISDILGVTGAALAPKLSIADMSMTYRTQSFLTGVPETLLVRVQNVGNEAILAPHFTTQLLYGANFQVGTIALPIPVSGAALLPVIFHPTRTGTKTDLLTISLDNDLPGDPDVVIHLQGGWYSSRLVGDGAIATGNLRILPTPAHGTVTVAFDAPRGGRAAIEICDLAGRTVARVERDVSGAGTVAATLRRGLDWSPAPGIYLARVTLEGRSIGSKRLVVLR